MSIIQKHWPALALAILIGGMVIAPYVYFARAEPQYAGITLWGEASEEYYVARIEEVYNGYPLPRNVYLPYKDVPYIVPGLGEDIVAYTGEALHVSAPTISIIWKFFSPFLAFLLIYALAFSVSRSRGTGLLAAASALLGLDLLSYPTHLVPLLWGESVSDGLFWGRPINPEVSGLFLFASLLWLYRAYYCGKLPRPWQSVALGLLIGGSLYVSIFIWVFLGAFLSLFFLTEMLRKHWEATKSACLTGAAILLSAVPLIVNYLHARGYPAYPNVAIQQGLAPLHTPIITIWVTVGFLLPLLLWPRAYERSRGFFLLSMGALLLALNQQVVTGLYEQPWHFHSYITKPLVCIMLALYAGWLIGKFVKPRILRIEAYFVVLLVLFLFGALSQVHFYDVHAPASRAAQGYAPLIAYLNTRPQETVFNNCESAYSCILSEYISMYSVDNAPESKYAAISIARPGYFQEMLFLHYRLMDVTAANAPAVMQRDQADILMRLYGEYWQLHDGTPSAVPKDEITQLAGEYASYASRPVPDMMRDLGVTMLVEDKRQSPTWNADLSALTPQSIADRFEVYTFPNTAQPYVMQ